MCVWGRGGGGWACTYLRRQSSQRSEPRVPGSTWNRCLVLGPVTSQAPVKPQSSPKPQPKSSPSQAPAHFKLASTQVQPATPLKPTAGSVTDASRARGACRRTSAGTRKQGVCTAGRAGGGQRRPRARHLRRLLTPNLPALALHGSAATSWVASTPTFAASRSHSAPAGGRAGELRRAYGPHLGTVQGCGLRAFAGMPRQCMSRPHKHLVVPKRSPSVLLASS
jgi:hypothetical protein